MLLMYILMKIFFFSRYKSKIICMNIVIIFITYSTHSNTVLHSYM